MNLNDVVNILRNAEDKAKREIGLVLETEWKKTINLNFAEQGRPAKWRPKRRNDGRAILTGRTGRLQRTINVGFDMSSNKVLVGSNLVYARVHQEGVTIHMRRRRINFRIKKGGWVKTTSDKRFTKVKIKENGEFEYFRKRKDRVIRAGANDSRTNKVSIQKSYVINIPARPYMVWTAEDTKRAIPNIKKAVELSFKP